MLEAKLNLQSLVDNSKTLEEVIKSPVTRDYLKFSQPSDKKMRKKSPKEVEITQIPEDLEIYQELDIPKGPSKTS